MRLALAISGLLMASCSLPQNLAVNSTSQVLAKADRSAAVSFPLGKKSVAKYGASVAYR